MKGHTKIELTDVNTGEVEVIEHDNMITSAIEKELLSSRGMMPMAIHNQAYGYYNNLDFIASLFGGIFLYRDSLSANADDYLLPFDNELIGYGYYNNTNSGNNRQLGSFSEVESGIQEDGSYKYVYNFDTSQANGQISAVALTPYYSGIISSGIKNENFDSTKVSPSSLIPSTYTFPDIDQAEGFNININYKGIPVYVDDNYVYLLNYDNFRYESDDFIGKNGNKLNIVRYPSKIGKLSIFDKYNLINTQIDSFTVDLPEDYLFTTNNRNNIFGRFFIDDQGIFYFMLNDSQTRTGSIELIKVDILNKLSVKYSVGLSTNYIWLNNITPVFENQSLQDVFHEMKVCKQKLIMGCRTKSSTTAPLNLLIYDLQTQKISVISDYPFTNKNNDIYISNPYNENFVIIKTPTSSVYFVLDVRDNNLKRLCCTDSYPSLYNYRFNGKYFYQSALTTAKKCYLQVSSPCQFLTTKNNLEKTVTKTSAQSMKVTYTLTPA